MIYFIYKLINITGYGGVSIPSIDGINGGQGLYGEYILGTADTMDHLNLIAEFQPKIISENVFKGLPLIGKTEITVHGFDGQPDTTRVLTTDEISWQTEAQNYIYKMNARDIIKSEVSDTLDLMTDISKKLDFIVRLATRMFGDYSGAYTMDAEIKDTYKVMIQQFLTAVDSGSYTCRTDLEDQDTLMTNLMIRDVKIANIVKTEYLDKKK